MSRVPNAERRSRYPVRRSRPSSRRVFLVCMIVIGLNATTLASTASVTKAPLHLLGKLPVPVDADSIDILEIDPVSNALFAIYDGLGGRYLAEYDLKPRLPVLKRRIFLGADFALLTTSPYVSDIDFKRGRLLMLLGSRIIVFDRNTSQLTSWDFATLLPGFVGVGLTYAPQDDRVYIVGEMVGAGFFTAGESIWGERPPLPSVVLALNPDGTRAWAAPLPQCQVLHTGGVGSLIARSSREPALYVPCARSSHIHTNMSGIARLRITSDATGTDALRFRQEFFPVSGLFLSSSGSTQGSAWFDPGTDRVFVQSLSVRTPGAWVFDGRLSAWVGFLASPEPMPHTGINTSTGHYYMAVSSGENGGDSALVISPGRGTPVPQGIEISGLSIANRPIVGDPGSDRVFIADAGSYNVYKDAVPDERPLRPPDYDALTSDIPERADTEVTFAGSTNGYGARAHIVGGHAGMTSFLGGSPPFTPASGVNALESISSGADRALSFARVSSVDISGSGTASSAQAAVADQNTDRERTDKAAGLAWPWEPATCLDGGGSPQSNPKPAAGGEALARCDLAKEIAEAKTSFGAVASENVAIGRSTFDTKVERDPELGTVTETRVMTQGVDIHVPQAGELSIAEVSAEVTTSAHGRPGTAAYEWERRLEGVVVHNASGETTDLGNCVTRSDSAASGSCRELAAAINDEFDHRLRIDFPRPDLIATPKGAFAGFQQSDSDFYHSRTVNNQGTAFTSEAASRAVPAVQLTVFNDSVEKSRLVVQLAAIQASSIYTVSRPEFGEIPDPPPPAAGSLPDSSTPVPEVGSAIPPAVDLADPAPLAQGDVDSDVPVASETGPVAAPEVHEGLAFLVRDRGQSMLFALLWLLLLGAAASAVRRQSLLRVVAGKGGGR